MVNNISMGCIENEAMHSNNIIGFFPGLGSRQAYQNLDDDLLINGSRLVKKIYSDAATALGFPESPERLILNESNYPQHRMEQQGFIGAAMLVHSLALEANLRSRAGERNLAVQVQAYTGESFGMITAAVASGSVSYADGAKIAQFFTPLILLASEKNHYDAYSQSVLDYYPAELRSRVLIEEPYYVSAISGKYSELNETLDAIGNHFDCADVCVHKYYSQTQVNIYIRASIKPIFELFLKNYPQIKLIQLKPPTRFLTHSKHLSSLRNVFEQFMVKNHIVFHTPHTAVISNNGAGTLTTAEEIKLGVLAIVDEVMSSQCTCQIADKMKADYVIEFGPGEKSVRLMADNDMRTPFFAYSGSQKETAEILDACVVSGAIANQNDNELLFNALREIFRLAQSKVFANDMMYNKIIQLIKAKIENPAIKNNLYYSNMERVFKNTYRYKEFIDLDSGELVLSARLKRDLAGEGKHTATVYAELKVLSREGSVYYKTTDNIQHPENTVVYFSGLDSMSNHDVFSSLYDFETADLPLCIKETIRERLSIQHLLDSFLYNRQQKPTTGIMALSRILHQVIMMELIKKLRPSIVHNDNYYLGATDVLGWLVSLVVSGAATLGNVLDFALQYYTPGGSQPSAWQLVTEFVSTLEKASVPVLSLSGTPVQARKDLADVTYKIMLDEQGSDKFSINLNCNLNILSLGEALDARRVINEGYHTETTSVVALSDVWQKGSNLALDNLELFSTSNITDDNEKVLNYALRRRLLCSTINSYVNQGEDILQFCNGGSESMTMFILRDDSKEIVVRKILSEALTAAKWNANGKGVMLPPFAKAAKQVDYLRALPPAVQPYFPRVYEVIKRDIPTPASQHRVGKTTCKEVIYEMSYVPGEEVGQFVMKYQPSARVVAKIYEQIMIFLRDNVHSVNKVPAPGNTLESSYFKKIEDRLELCKKTAPQTFNSSLLNADKIVINGVSYLNVKGLLAAFRSRPEYCQVLEPQYHSLVMGDTNTENIKIGNIAPLLAAHHAITAQSSEAEIEKALQAITAAAMEIRFLDPRAIGYNSEGASCRDDYMYDNKPWHNAIGHYDELHNELFELSMSFDDSPTPHVRVNFVQGNPYQKAYKVVDATARRLSMREVSSLGGMEAYFSQVMNSVYDLENPDSPYLKEDPFWLIRFVFMMGTHFTAMPPFHFISEMDGTLIDNYHSQRRPVAIYCEGIKWLNWALEMLEGKRSEFLGLQVPALKHMAAEAM